MFIFARFNALQVAVVFTLLWLSLGVRAAPLNLDQIPVFAQDATPSNLILGIDDSGSMDAEILVYSNDGALWWNTSADSFTDSGAVNFNAAGAANGTWKKYIYLYPNGTGGGNRVYGDSSNHHYAVPPLPQYAYVRSSSYNIMYYDPNQTYSVWESAGSATFSNIDPTAVRSDPVDGGSTFNLTNKIRNNNSHHLFRIYDDMRIPEGTVYWYDGSGTSEWRTLSSDVTVPSGSLSNNKSVGIEYDPLVYHVVVTSGNYSINSGATTGSCSSPNSAHYPAFEANPDWDGIGSPTKSNVFALAPDGTCLKRVVIKPSVTAYAHSGGRTDCASTTNCTYAEELQNFANWFGYYRNRHLALRAGFGTAFASIESLRAGYVKINNRVNVTMKDLSVAADKVDFYDAIYDIGGNGGGTPNREALKHIGEQFMRTDGSAPVIEECQKNFALFFTDGYANLSTPSVSDQDNDEGSPYADSYDGTMGDIANHYYKTILRTGAGFPTGEVPIDSGCYATPTDPQLDCNSNLHMNTYTVGMGAKGASVFGVTHFDVNDAYDTPPVWPNSNSDRNATQVDDLYHAAVNGRGEIYNATSAADLQEQLVQALADIQAAKGSAAGVSFSTTIPESSSKAFQAIFNTGSWTGDLQAMPLSPYGYIDASTVLWSAADELDDGTPTFTTRNILTYDAVAGEGKAFRLANLTSSQLDDVSAADWGTPAQVVDYLRGNQSFEGANQFRIRTSLLGDFINSAPEFVGQPTVPYPSGGHFPSADESHLNFRLDLRDNPRNEIVYVASNDGMLHGFSADNGEELIAYIPNLVYSDQANQGLHYLTESDYRHRFYVDQPIKAQDAYIYSRVGTSESWRTLIVGGLGAGGRGVYALDVTDPSTFSEANADDLVLWEFTHPDLGNVFGAPYIGVMENGRWAAVFGNGYNSDSETAKLFVVFLEGGLDGVWTDGTAGTDLDYLIIDTNAEPSNGLSKIKALDMNLDGAIDRVYAGDLQGNMWAFNLSSSTTSGWGSDYSSGGTAAPLFTAEAGGKRQPIMTQPAFSVHPDASGSAPDVMVFFGTGKYTEFSDVTNTDQQSFYGIWDHGQDELDRGNLQEQTMTFNGYSATLSNNLVNGAEDGWYIDLPFSGERVTVDAITRGDYVYFVTNIPSSEPCTSGGSSWVYGVSKEHGGMTANQIIDANWDGEINDADKVSSDVQNATLIDGMINSLTAFGDTLVMTSTDDSVKPATGGTTADGDEMCVGSICTAPVTELENLSGRLSWQELIND